MKKLFVNIELWYILQDLFYHGCSDEWVVKFYKKRSVSGGLFDFAPFLHRKF